MSESAMSKHDRLVWIDLEMTGLDPDHHVVVEVAALVTDADLNILGQGVDIVVHATEEQLAGMNELVADMHGSSGLTEAIRTSTTTIEQAEQAVLDLIAEHCDPDHPAPLAGNSIATDRSFIRKHMPRLDNALHYRMIDVSTLKELARRWYPRVYFNQPEKGRHRGIHPRAGLLSTLVHHTRSRPHHRRMYRRREGIDGLVPALFAITRE